MRTERPQHVGMRPHQPGAAHGEASDQRRQQDPGLDQGLAVLGPQEASAPARDQRRAPSTRVTNTAAPLFSSSFCSATETVDP